MHTDYATVTLSDSDWMLLLDGLTARNGLLKCCPNVAHLRDLIFRVARNGGEVNPFLRTAVIDSFGRVIGEGHHDVNIPALAKFMVQLGVDRPPAHKPMLDQEIEHI